MTGISIGLSWVPAGAIITGVTVVAGVAVVTWIVYKYIERRRRSFGKNIIVTDNTDWTTTDIVEAHLERWQVEDRFRQSKDPGHVGTRPVRHWTDGKIRCHLFTCVVALTYVRRLELRLEERGIRLTANKALDELSKLYSILSIDARERKPRRALENSRVRPKPRSYRPWATGSIPVGAYTLSVLEIRSGSNFGVDSGGLPLKLLCYRQSLCQS